jgi:hypothetical protein
MGMLGVVMKADSKLSGRQAAMAKLSSLTTRGEARAYIREVMAKVEAVRANRRKE